MTDAETWTGEGASVVRNSERELAVTHWLLSAAEDRERARDGWAAKEGIALLKCGGILAAIRLPARLVWCAAESEELETADAYLCQALDGPVFMDLHALHYYTLVPGLALERFSVKGLPGVACIGQDHYLGVPDIRLTTPRGHSYWCVPMDSPGVLCPVAAVEAMVCKGRAHMAAGACR